MWLAGASHCGCDDAVADSPTKRPSTSPPVDREEQPARIRIAGDEPEVEAERTAQHHRHVVAGGALGGATEHQRRPAEPARIVDRLHRGVLADEQEVSVVGVARRGAEPGQRARVEPHIGVVADDGEERHVARKGGDRGAVVRRGIGEEVDGAQTAGARHVLHDHVWIAGNVPAEMSGEQPSIDVIAAAGAVADDQLDLLALVELGDRIGARIRERKHERRRRDDDPQHGASPSRFLLRAVCHAAPRRDSAAAPGQATFKRSSKTI